LSLLPENRSFPFPVQGLNGYKPDIIPALIRESVAIPDGGKGFLDEEEKQHGNST
jgi:hypothetical protein